MWVTPTPPEDDPPFNHLWGGSNRLFPQHLSLMEPVSGQGCVDKVRVRVGGVCDLLMFLARVVWTR